MKPVYHCKACGFVSTITAEYSVISGLMFCIGYIDDYKRGIEPACQWIKDAIEQGKEQPCQSTE